MKKNRNFVKIIGVIILLFNPLTAMLVQNVYYASSKPKWEDLPLDHFLSHKYFTVIDSRHDKHQGYFAEFIIKTNYIEAFIHHMKLMEDAFPLFSRDECTMEVLKADSFESNLKNYGSIGRFFREKFQGSYQNEEICIYITREEQSEYAYIAILYQ